jgi:23S rRNA (cytosine1962-C5)-methyltransferase
MNRLYLKAGEELSLRQGFPWVYDNEIEKTDADSNVAEVFSQSGLFLGTGFVNKASKIRVRMLSPDRGVILDEAFFQRLVQRAYELRFAYYGKSDSYRLIFSEADFFPGLIVDRFAAVNGEVFLVVQFLSQAVEFFRREILAALEKVCRPRGIMERSDAPIRALEGLEERKGPVFGHVEPIITIKENGLLLRVDLAAGQKTGYFLDQKDNRRAVTPFAKGKRVLDAFCHTGAFALNAAKAGAKEVLAADISPDAIALVTENAALNRLEKTIKPQVADVFDLLKSFDRAGERFGLVILDPPAFAKNSKAMDAAFGGYKEINLRAMKILDEGGVLVTCSCSGAFTPDRFYGMLTLAAADAKRRVQILEKRSAGPDHPLLAGFAKSEYLKCAILRVV